MRMPPWTGNDSARAAGAAGRWIRPDLAAVPCGARTRAGTPCQAPAVSGRRRCRMHGGAAGSGAPRGNRNALRHGWWSAAARAERRHAAALIAAAERALEALAEEAAVQVGAQRESGRDPGQTTRPLVSDGTNGIKALASIPNRPAERAARRARNATNRPVDP